MRFLPLLLATTAQAFVLTCNEVNTQNGASAYDLSDLAGGKAASRFTDTPPTRSEAKIRFNLCDGVKPEDERPDSDQCPADSRACFQIINHKGDDTRVVSVVNLWPADVPERDVDVRQVDEGLTIEVRGPEYAGTRQKLEIKLNCKEEEAGPDVESYTDGTLTVTWDHPAACGRIHSPPSSGGGWFSSLLWFIIIVFILYLVGGAVYNHQQYGARGLDLLPHKTFWQELPVLARDFSSHIFSNVRDSGRGGYSSLG